MERTAAVDRPTNEVPVIISAGVSRREPLRVSEAQRVSYEKAVAVCSLAVGTVKCRGNRARLKLAYLLDLNSDVDLGPDALIKAALAAE